MKFGIYTAAIAIAVANISVAHADAAAAETKAKTLCAGCHGPEGISTNALWPNLAGQKDQYLAKAIKDYRDGNRSDPTMGPIATPLTDEEIQDLAAYFSKL